MEGRSSRQSFSNRHTVGRRSSGQRPAHPSPFQADLALGEAGEPGNFDLIRSIENVIGVSNSTNTLIGDDRDNLLEGGLEDDHIEGRGGNDTLHGDDGNDTLDGGLGTDTCLEGETVINCE
jgi:Ca2+-binding RTX toxin-like protein